MATTTDITTTYNGEFAGKYISAALLSGKTLSENAISIHPNVKFKEMIQRVELDDILMDGTCEFTDTSTLTMTERFLEPKDLQVNLKLCKSDFQVTWQAIEMGYSSFDVLPPSFVDYLLGYVAGKVAQKVEKNIYQGVRTNEGEWDGFETRLGSDADLPAGQRLTGATITADNVIDELGAVVDAIPEALYGHDGLTIYCAQNVVRAYIRALGGFTAATDNNGVDSKGTMWFNGQELFIDGVRIFMSNGMSSNIMIAALKENMWFGCGLLSDQNEVRVIDTAETLGDKNVRVVMRMSADTNYGVVEDIVTSGIPLV